MAEIVEVQPEALPTYDSTQQVYCISAASNAVGLKANTTKGLEKDFKDILDELLPQLTPVQTWKTAWGPTVFKWHPNDAKTPPVNAWFVAQNDKDKVLIAGIAGTAAHSNAAWLGDVDVVRVVNYDKWTTQWTTTRTPLPTGTLIKLGPLVSHGTCSFIHHILTTPSPAAAPGTLLGKFLQDFQNQHQDYSIIFTGHSMGGAVVPALALGLVQSKIIKNSKIYVMPSAGASPGNEAFNTTFSKAFPVQGPYNFNYFNNLDVVPQAWSIIPTADRRLANMKTIYATAQGKAAQKIDNMVKYGTDLSVLGTKYIGLPGAAFDGPTIPDGITEGGDLSKQVKTQHIDAYWAQWKITAFVKVFEDLLKKKEGKSVAAFEDANDEEVAAVFEAAVKDADEAHVRDVEGNEEEIKQSAE